MPKEEEYELEIVLNLIEKEDVFNSFLPAFLLSYWKEKSDYEKNINKIQKALDYGDRGEILNVLYFLESHETNGYELAKITKHPYSMIHKYLKELESLKIIVLEKGKSPTNRPQLTVKINPKVKLISYSEYIEKGDFKRSIQDELEDAKKSEKNFKKMVNSYN